MFTEDQHSDPHGAGHNGEQRDVQTPLLLHEMQSPEEAFGLPAATKRPRQLAVVMLLVVGAVVCIFAMRRFGLGALPAFGGAELDYKPAQATSAASAKQVLAELERSRKAVQVSAEHIKHDPFELAGVAPVEAPVIDPNAGAGEAARRAEEQRLAREKLLAQAFSGLQLQGMMQGATPVARINGALVKVGMTVGEHFTVAAIEGRGVTLTADGKEFVLTLDVGPDESGDSGRRN
ncbi:MAG TPA: hypothetical protein VFF69_00055 [Phycisphaerales bacterium]|nr:hypothetical protein [Phycisphaerales bacterium]